MVMNPYRQNVISKAGLRADLYTQSQGSRGEWVFITFTERCNSELEGLGFGGDFLLRQGFDLLAVKNIVDDWYIDLGQEELSVLNESICSYERRASYGSSMGAFAAIKFAKSLGVCRALGISPILDVQFDWDTRHVADLAVMRSSRNWIDGDMFTNEDVSPDTTYHVAFDPLCIADARHARRLAEMVDHCTLLNVRLGGHPVGPTMRDCGVLGPFVRQVIAENSIAGLNVSIEKNGRYLSNLARYLFERNKIRSALVVTRRALEISPDCGETHLLAAQIAYSQGDVARTLEYGRRAVELSPLNPYMVEIVNRMLLADGQPGS
jgi:hypothetical protein